ncbi:hypothetical protein RCS94_06610 [Orbaceae bacterium ac157xtp]
MQDTKNDKAGERLTINMIMSILLHGMIRDDFNINQGLDPLKIVAFQAFKMSFKDKKLCDIEQAIDEQLTTLRRKMLEILIN